MNNTFNTNTDSNMSTKLNSEDEEMNNDEFDDGGADDNDDNARSYYDEKKKYEHKTITLTSLTSREKKIILEEFCEIMMENSEIDSKNEISNKVPKIEQDEIGISDLFKEEPTNDEMSNNNNMEYKNQMNTNDCASSSSGSPFDDEPTTISQILQAV